MATPHINESATHSQPREAAVGQLTEESTIESVTAALEAIGIDADRIYFLVGEDGATMLEDTKGFFSIFDDIIERPIGSLREGKTLVGVFGVKKDDVDRVRETLVEAGVTNTHYFGRWTYS